MSTAIQFEDITKEYEGKTIIENLNLSIGQGEFVTIIGSSGCGKTTTLKMVNGLIKPEKGTITIHGEDIKTKDMTTFRRTIGYAIQGSVLFPHMNVEENIAYVPNLLNKKEKEYNKKKSKNALAVIYNNKIIAFIKRILSFNH